MLQTICRMSVAVCVLCIAACRVDAEPLSEDRGDNYLISYIKTDELGHFTSRTELKTLVSELVDRLPGPNARNPTGALVVAFVHGWKHSADSADTNVCCFREIIKRLAEREARINPAGPRKVIGVYFSWPAGQSTLGFWRIKDRADFVGYGHIMKVLTILDNIKRQRPDAMQLISIGHSFGARILFDATHATLEARVMEQLTKDGLDGKIDGLVRHLEAEHGPTVSDEIRGFGDLIVLVNPAFEASRYHVINDLKVTGQRFVRTQKTLMLVVSANNDEATGTWFPRSWIGLVPWNAQSERQDKEARHTLGNVAEFRTHKLQQCQPTTVQQALECTCQTQIPTLSRVANPEVRAGESSGPLCVGPLRLVPIEAQNDRNPFIVASTDATVINDHNGLFTKPFMEFLFDFAVKGTPPGPQ
jgi:hypothetical protein